MISASEPYWDLLYVIKGHHGKNFSSSFLTGSVHGEGEVNVTSHWIAKPEYTEYKTARVGNWNGVKHVIKSNIDSIRFKFTRFTSY